MAIIGKLPTKVPSVTYGTRYDYCWFCAEEKLRENLKDPNNHDRSRELAGNSLKGQLDGKPVFKFSPFGSGPYLFCYKHMKELVAAMDDAAKPKKK